MTNAWIVRHRIRLRPRRGRTRDRSVTVIALGDEATGIALVLTAV